MSSSSSGMSKRQRAAPAEVEGETRKALKTSQAENGVARRTTQRASVISKRTSQNSAPEESSKPESILSTRAQKEKKADEKKASSTEKSVSEEEAALESSASNKSSEEESASTKPSEALSSIGNTLVSFDKSFSSSDGPENSTLNEESMEESTSDQPAKPESNTPNKASGLADCLEVPSSSVASEEEKKFRNKVSPIEDKLSKEAAQQESAAPAPDLVLPVQVSVSKETESVSKETPHMEKPIPAKAPSPAVALLVEKSVSKETQAVSKETQAVSKEAPDAEKPIPDKDPSPAVVLSVEKSLSNETKSVSKETQSVSKEAPQTEKPNPGKNPSCHVALPVEKSVSKESPHVACPGPDKEPSKQNKPSTEEKRVGAEDRKVPGEERMSLEERRVAAEERKLAAAEKKALAAEKKALAAERKALAAEKKALAAEKKAMKAEGKIPPEEPRKGATATTRQNGIVAIMDSSPAQAGESGKPTPASNEKKKKENVEKSPSKVNRKEKKDQSSTKQTSGPQSISQELPPVETTAPAVETTAFPGETTPAAEAPLETQNFASHEDSRSKEDSLQACEDEGPELSPELKVFRSCLQDGTLVIGDDHCFCLVSKDQVPQWNVEGKPELAILQQQLIAHPPTGTSRCKGITPYRKLCHLFHHCAQIVGCSYHKVMAEFLRKKLKEPGYVKPSDFQYTMEVVNSRGSLENAKEAVNNKRALDIVGKEALPANKKIAVQIEAPRDKVEVPVTEQVIAAPIAKEVAIIKKDKKELATNDARPSKKVTLKESKEKKNDRFKSLQIQGDDSPVLWPPYVLIEDLPVELCCTKGIKQLMDFLGLAPERILPGRTASGSHAIREALVNFAPDHKGFDQAVSLAKMRLSCVGDDTMIKTLCEETTFRMPSERDMQIRQLLPCYSKARYTLESYKQKVVAPRSSEAGKLQHLIQGKNEMLSKHAQARQEAERKGQWIAQQQILQLQKEEEKFKILEQKLNEKVQEEHDKVLVLQNENEVMRQKLVEGIEKNMKEGEEGQTAIAEAFRDLIKELQDRRITLYQNENETARLTEEKLLKTNEELQRKLEALEQEHKGTRQRSEGDSKILMDVSGKEQTPSENVILPTTSSNAAAEVAELKEQLANMTKLLKEKDRKIQDAEKEFWEQDKHIRELSIKQRGTDSELADVRATLLAAVGPIGELRPLFREIIPAEEIGELDFEKFRAAVHLNRKSLNDLTIARQFDRIDEKLVRNPNYTPFIQKVYKGGQLKEINWQDSELLKVKTELGEGAMRYVAETLQISDSVNPSGRYPVMKLKEKPGVVVKSLIERIKGYEKEKQVEVGVPAKPVAPPVEAPPAIQAPPAPTPIIPKDGPCATN